MVLAPNAEPGRCRERRWSASARRQPAAAGATAKGVPLVNVLRTILRAVAIVDGLVCLYALIQACALTVFERRRTIAVLRACGAGGGAVALVLAGAVAMLVVPAAILGVLLERFCSDQRSHASPRTTRRSRSTRELRDSRRARRAGDSRCRRRRLRLVAGGARVGRRRAVSMRRVSRRSLPARVRRRPRPRRDRADRRRMPPGLDSPAAELSQQDRAPQLMARRSCPHGQTRTGTASSRSALANRWSTREDLGAKAAYRTTLGTVAHLTDAHVMDAASPARVTFLARLGPPFQSTFRPHEALTASGLPRRGPGCSGARARSRARGRAT